MSEAAYWQELLRRIAESAYLENRLPDLREVAIKERRERLYEQHLKNERER